MSKWSAGREYYSNFEDLVKSSKSGTPSGLTSPRFPDSPKNVYMPEIPESLPGEDPNKSHNVPASHTLAKKLLKLPPPNVMEFGQTLNKPNSFPQMEGEYEVIAASAQEVHMTQKFMKAFDYWIILAHLFFKTKFYEIQWEKKEKFDLIFMRIDPILLNMATQEPKYYVQLFNVGIPSIAGCNLDKFDVQTKAERSKNPYPDHKNKHRRDTIYTIVGKFSCPVVTGKALYHLTTGTTEYDPSTKMGELGFEIKNLVVNSEIIIAKIDESFARGNIRYRPPKMSLSYDVEDIQVVVHSVPESSTMTDLAEIQRRFDEYKINEILNDKQKTAERMIKTYLLRLTPLIVRLKWIHQLHDVMNLVMINEKGKEIPEFSKLQTKLVEAVFFSLLNDKFRDLIFTSLKQQSYEPFKKLIYFRECKEQKTVEQLQRLESPAELRKKGEDPNDVYSRIIDEENSVNTKKVAKIVKLNYYVMRFFTESILI